jgi:hypothetical protein
VRLVPVADPALGIAPGASGGGYGYPPRARHPAPVAADMAIRRERAEAVRRERAGAICRERAGAICRERAEAICRERGTRRHWRRIWLSAASELKLSAASELKLSAGARQCPKQPRSRGCPNSLTESGFSSMMEMHGTVSSLRCSLWHQRSIGPSKRGGNPRRRNHPVPAHAAATCASLLGGTPGIQGGGNHHTRP